MSSSGKRSSPLLGAAAALDEELARFQHLAESAQQAKITTQKQLARARATLAEGLASQQRVAEQMQALGLALAAAGEENARSVEALARRHQEVEQRTAQVDELVARFAQLEQVAGQISSLVKSVGDQAAEGGAPADALAALAGIESQMADVARVAEEMVSVARVLEMADLVSDADAMRQQLQAARNKVHAVRERIGGPIGES